MIQRYEIWETTVYTSKFEFLFCLLQNPNGTISTNMYTYLKWPINGTPESLFDILQLLSDMEDSQNPNKKSPVLVICR